MQRANSYRENDDEDYGDEVAEVYLEDDPDFYGDRVFDEDNGAEYRNDRPAEAELTADAPPNEDRPEVNVRSTSDYIRRAAESRQLWYVIFYYC